MFLLCKCLSEGFQFGMCLPLHRFWRGTSSVHCAPMHLFSVFAVESQLLLSHSFLCLPKLAPLFVSVCLRFQFLSLSKMTQCFLSASVCLRGPIRKVLANAPLLGKSNLLTVHNCTCFCVCRRIPLV